MESADNDLVNRLREEANEVKRCVTTYSFGALTFSSAVFTAVTAAIERIEWVAFAGIPVIALLMVVCRISIYKYSTANRNYGYELHLARLESFKPKCKPEMYRAIKEIEWEEGLRAWRIVQTSMFREIYQVSENMNCKWLRFFDWRLFKLKPNHEDMVDKYTARILKMDDTRFESGPYPWFMPFELARFKGEDHSSYHAGTYLQNMITIMVLMQYFMVLPMIFMVSRVSVDGWLRIAYLVSALLMTSIIFLRQKRIKRRRELLENEMLSIHSCGVVWQAVALAHVLAKENCKGFCEHYTEHLVALCQEIKKQVYDIHQWFETHMGKHRRSACPLRCPGPKDPSN